MTNTYHNNDSGGTAYHPTPKPPIGDLQPESEHSNPTLSVRETHFQIGGNTDERES